MYSKYLYYKKLCTHTLICYVIDLEYLTVNFLGNCDVRSRYPILSYRLKLSFINIAIGVKLFKHNENIIDFFLLTLFQIYYRIHAGALKLLEKHDNLSLSMKLFTKIKLALDQTSNMSIFNENK